MLYIARDIQSLTAFRRRSGEFMKQLRKSKRPVVLTVKGKAAAVVQDAEAYQRLLDIAAQADAGEGIRQGLQDVSEGRVRPAKEFLNSKPGMAYVNLSARAKRDLDYLYPRSRPTIPTPHLSGIED
jgi:prevent-host-death family protein